MDGARLNFRQHPASALAALRPDDFDKRLRLRRRDAPNLWQGSLILLA
jgi:hypothetical protein